MSPPPLCFECILISVTILFSSWLIKDIQICTYDHYDIVRDVTKQIQSCVCEQEFETAHYSFLDLLQIEWMNNTNCQWRFVHGTSTQKYTAKDAIQLVDHLSQCDVSLSFFGDSVVRRTASTLKEWVNHLGNVSTWHDHYLHQHQNQNWTLNIDDSSHFKYTNYWTPCLSDIVQQVRQINTNQWNQRNYILLMSTGIHDIEKMLSHSKWTLWNETNGFRLRTHEYIEKYLNLLHLVIQNVTQSTSATNIDVIFRTQTAMSRINTAHRVIKQCDFDCMTRVWNDVLLRSIEKNKYSMFHVFDSYHWSRDDGKHMYYKLSANGLNTEPAHGILRQICNPTVNHKGVHMNSASRDIVIQQTLNAINYVAKAYC